MKIDIAVIRNQINLKSCIERYTGGRFNRNGFIRCPFHTDKTPSLSIKGERFRCFSCDRGGDVIDFTREYFSLEFRAACKKLSDDYGLHLNIDCKESVVKKPVGLWDRAISDHAEQRERTIKAQIEQTEKERERIEKHIREMIQQGSVNWKEIDRLEDEADRKDSTIRFMRALKA